jgi:hypothetical protein
LFTCDPNLAAHYKAMAADPYGTLAKYQDAEAARAAMREIPYGANEHAVNPWRKDDLQGQSAFIKNAPPGFAKFCKNEAKDVEVPLFGRNRNMTIEGRLAKDPQMFALMKTAQQVRGTWRAEDARAAAQEQRAAAEAALRKLEAAA